MSAERDTTRGPTSEQLRRRVLERVEAESVLTVEDQAALGLSMADGRPTYTLDAATYDAVRRALNHVDATDPCPLCDSWPEHAGSCSMAAPELDTLIGRGPCPPIEPHA